MKTQVSILHMADVHLLERQYANSMRGQDFKNAFKQAIQIGLTNKVDAICVSGDLFDNSRPSTKLMTILKEAHALLKMAGVPMYVVNGDHDNATPSWSSLLEEELEVDKGIQVIDGKLMTVPDTDLNIYGVPYFSKNTFPQDWLIDNDEENFKKAQIVMWHGMLNDFLPENIRQFVECDGLDALPPYGENDIPRAAYLLGDVHIRNYIPLENGTMVGYPGSLEMCKQDEPTDKSVSLITFKKTDYWKVHAITPIKIDTRKVCKYVITSEAKLEEALLDVGNYKNDNPIVYVRYKDTIKDVMKRFYTLLDDSKCIVRENTMRTPEVVNVSTGEEAEELNIIDFLPKLLTPGSSKFTLTQQLLTPKASVATVLDTYVESRRDELQHLPTS